MEVLGSVAGSVAAAVRLADAGLRTFIRVYSFAVDLKEAPKRLHALHDDITALHNFVVELEAETHRVDGILANANPS